MRANARSLRFAGSFRTAIESARRRCVAALDIVARCQKFALYITGKPAVSAAPVVSAANPGTRQSSAHPAKRGQGYSRYEGIRAAATAAGYWQAVARREKKVGAYSVKRRDARSARSARFKAFAPATSCWRSPRRWPTSPRHIFREPRDRTLAAFGRELLARGKRLPAWRFKVAIFAPAIARSSCCSAMTFDA